ncbi:MAG: PAS domain-containing protein [Minicystis sp.]
MAPTPLPPHVAPPSPGFLEEVVRHIAHPIFVKDRAFRFVWVNDAFRELVELPRDALLGKTDHDFFHRDQADFFRLKDREVFERGVTVTIEEEPFTDALQRQHVLATTKVPLRGAGGDITHLVGICHDITDLKTVEEQLRLANEDLERRVEERTRALRDAQNALLRKERLAVLGQLSGGLAHQIRTPLTTISNAAAVLRRKLAGTTDPDARTALEIIAEEIWEANRIITDLLDFARVRPPSAARVPVAALIDGALGAARPPEGIAVQRDVPPSLIAWVDERQTRDAIGNVIRNALEAMGDAGRLTLRADEIAPYACIAVEDTGPGLEDEALVHLFEPLVTTKALGLGLGLTTARALIENQGGDIRYVRPTGGGARFEIRVPLAGPDQS